MMKKSATFLAIAGIAAISSPAIAETKEASFNQTATDFEYVTNQNTLIAEQPQDSDITDEGSDEEERADGEQVPRADEARAHRVEDGERVLRFEGPKPQALELVGHLGDVVVLRVSVVALAVLAAMRREAEHHRSLAR